MIKFLYPFNKTSLTLIGILAFGVWLRILCLPYGLPTKNMALSTYHPDESISYYVLEKMNPKKLDFNPREGLFWGGSHIYILAVALKISELFQYVKIGPRSFYKENLQYADRLYIVGRILMILFAFANIILIYVIGKSMFSSQTGLIASFLTAFLPLHIFGSLHVRPDIPMFFWLALGLYFILKFIEEPNIKYSFLAGASTGLACATKYNAVMFIIILALYWYFYNKKIKYLGVIFAGIFLGFIFGCPYSILGFNDFKTFFLGNFLTFKTSYSSIDLLKWVNYFRYYLPYALGKPLFFASIAGMVYLLLFKKNKHIFILTISSIIMYFIMSIFSKQSMLYTFPLMIPLTLIVSESFVELWTFKKRYLTYFMRIAILAIGFYTILYSSALLKIIYMKNTRELASEWIDENIPKDKVIGIAKSFYWTPPIIRQYNPPYTVLIAGHIRCSRAEGFRNMPSIIDKIDYFILSDQEYIPMLVNKKKFSQESMIITEIMNTYSEIKRFEKRLTILGITFDSKYPKNPHLGMSIIYPTIHIYKIR